MAPILQVAAMDGTLKAHLLRYIEEGTSASFLQLREAVMGFPGFDPYSVEPEAVATFLDERRFEEGRELLMAAMDHFVLSPRLHLTLAMVHERLGDEEGAALEEGIAHLLLESLASLGKGTQGEPYLITHIRDEYDLMGYLHKESTAQSLVYADGRSFDRHLCADGSEVWFDITPQKTALDEMLRAASLRRPR
jgi:hypothetical protein